MIDTQTAISYLKQVVTQLETKEDENHHIELELEAKKTKLVKDTADLVEQKSAFFSQTSEMTAKLEQAEKMKNLAAKIKIQADEDTKANVVRSKELDKREKGIVDLEALEKQLKEEKRLLDIRLEAVEEREIMVEKDKQAARSKQEDLAILEKGIKTTQARLQGMLDAQAVV